VQEALTNVKKHAPGSEVSLSVEVWKDEVIVVISDTGPGFDVEPALTGGRQFGLRTMQERAESVGGSVRFESRPGVGTTVKVIVPAESARGG
jgi:signal transduction histidine kinase